MAEEKDIRFQRVEGFIRETMIQLLQEKSFHQITVDDICKQAKISRSGFYLHYKDKYDLVEQYVDSMIKMGTDSFLSHANSPDFIFAIVKFMCGDGKLLALLISDNGSPEVQKMLLSLIRQNAKDNILVKIGVQTKNEAELNYLICYLSNASFGILQEWIRSGQKETPEELARIMKTISTIMKHVY